MCYFRLKSAPHVHPFCRVKNERKKEEKNNIDKTVGCNPIIYLWILVPVFSTPHRRGKGNHSETQATKARNAQDVQTAAETANQTSRFIYTRTLLSATYELQKPNRTFQSYKGWFMPGVTRGNRLVRKRRVCGGDIKNRHGHPRTLTAPQRHFDPFLCSCCFFFVRRNVGVSANSKSSGTGTISLQVVFVRERRRKCLRLWRVLEAIPSIFLFCLPFSCQPDWSAVLSWAGEPGLFGSLESTKRRK